MIARTRTSAARAFVGVAALALGLTAGGCGPIEEAPVSVHEPAKAEQVTGLDVKKVTFDRQAAERVSLRTAVVRRTESGTVLPYAALIYDEHGVVWVYTNPAPLTFQRVEVVVDRIVDDLVRLRHGPAPGTRVVTVGATQVYGAELDVAGGQ
jgi:hypothetical protein